MLEGRTLGWHGVGSRLHLRCPVLISSGVAVAGKPENGNFSQMEGVFKSLLTYLKCCYRLERTRPRRQRKREGSGFQLWLSKLRLEMVCMLLFQIENSFFIHVMLCLCIQNTQN